MAGNVCVISFDGKVEKTVANVAQTEEEEQEKSGPECILSRLPVSRVWENSYLLTTGEICEICFQKFRVGEYVNSLPCAKKHKVLVARFLTPDPALHVGPLSECITFVSVRLDGAFQFHIYCIENWIKHVGPYCPEDRENLDGTKKQTSNAECEEGETENVSSESSAKYASKIEEAATALKTTKLTNETSKEQRNELPPIMETDYALFQDTESADSDVETPAKSVAHVNDDNFRKSIRYLRRWSFDSKTSEADRTTSGKTPRRTKDMLAVCKRMTSFSKARSTARDNCSHTGHSLERQKDSLGFRNVQLHHPGRPQPANSSWSVRKTNCSGTTPFEKASLSIENYRIQISKYTKKAMKLAEEKGVNHYLTSSSFKSLQCKDPFTCNKALQFQDLANKLDSSTDAVWVLKPQSLTDCRYSRYLRNSPSFRSIGRWPVKSKEDAKNGLWH